MRKKSNHFLREFKDLMYSFLAVACLFVPLVFIIFIMVVSLAIAGAYGTDYENKNTCDRYSYAYETKLVSAFCIYCHSGCYIKNKDGVWIDSRDIVFNKEMDFEPKVIR